MKELINNFSDSKLPIIISIVTVFITVVLKYYISSYQKKKDGTINFKIKKDDIDIEIKNINPKDINIEEIIKKLDEKSNKENKSENSR